MMLSPGALINVAIVLPLLAALGIVVSGRFANLREACSLSFGVLLLLTNLALLRQWQGGVTLDSHWLDIIPTLGLSFQVEPLGLIFALVASCLWPVTICYAIGYMRGNNEQNQTRFYACFAVAISAVMGIAFAENLFTLFVFYEVLSLCTYPLVTHAGTDKARHGGRVYLGILLSTSIAFFLPAIIITWLTSGTLSFTPGGVFADGTSPLLLSALLVLFVFGIGKAALMPFHRWLPAAMVAPTPVSALLHAVAVVKAGVFSVLKITVYIFGIDTLASIPASQWLIYLAGASILLASLVAMRQDNIKARLAYSTISQLGYVTLGALLASSYAATGSAMHIVMHAFGKITLFFCAGAIYTAAHKTLVSELDGLGWKMPFTFAAFTLASLSIIGLPPLGGAWSKWSLMLGAADSGQLLMIAVLALSSLLNIVYLLELPARAFLRGPAVLDRQEAPLASLLPLCFTALCCILLFFYAGHIMDLLQGVNWS